jgi:hypothetical protein
MPPDQVFASGLIIAGLILATAIGLVWLFLPFYLLGRLKLMHEDMNRQAKMTETWLRAIWDKQK